METTGKKNVEFLNVLANQNFGRCFELSGSSSLALFIRNSFAPVSSESRGEKTMGMSRRRRMLL